MGQTSAFSQLLSRVSERAKSAGRERSICTQVGHTWGYKYEEASGLSAALCTNCRRLAILDGSHVRRCSAPLSLPSPTPAKDYMACCDGLVREFFNEFAAGQKLPTMIEEEIQEAPV